LFEGPSYPNGLDESVFVEWLKKGHLRKILFAYLFVIWDKLDRTYMPVYVEQQCKLKKFASLFRLMATNF
jgi:hypothetical protein